MENLQVAPQRLIVFHHLTLGCEPSKIIAGSDKVERRQIGNGIFIEKHFAADFENRNDDDMFSGLVYVSHADKLTAEQRQQIVEDLVQIKRQIASLPEPRSKMQISKLVKNKRLQNKFREMLKRMDQTAEKLVSPTVTSYGDGLKFDDAKNFDVDKKKARFFDTRSQMNLASRIRLGHGAAVAAGGSRSQRHFVPENFFSKTNPNFSKGGAGGLAQPMK